MKGNSKDDMELYLELAFTAFAVISITAIVAILGSL